MTTGSPYDNMNERDLMGGRKRSPELEDDPRIVVLKTPRQARADVPPKVDGELPLDADHYRIGAALIDRLTADYGTRPVYTLGQFWVIRNNLWEALDADAVAAIAGRHFGGMRYCHRGSDFKSVAWLAARIVADDRFFERGAIGIAGPENFWRVAPGGILHKEPLRPDHRVRTRVAAEPDFEGEAPRFSGLLAQAFGDDPDARQRGLLQRLFGAAISRQLWRMRTVGLLLGATTTGKSTLLTILKSLYPEDQVSATNPQRWDSEYYRAALAGKTLNIVGELDANQPIPGGSFKSVVGQDVIEGRHPTHRPFSFVCQSSHFFNSNKLPPTTDRSDAFFKRWRIVLFRYPVPDDEIILDLAELIVAEEIGPVLAWLLEGAAAVASEGQLPTTPEHDAQMAKWRNANNSALQFVVDPEQCQLDPEASTDGQTLFNRYQRWADDNGVRKFGRSGFYEALEEGGGRIGVRRREHGNQVAFLGVWCKL